MIQNNYSIIGLTGGIATGKSTVSEILAGKDYPIIDADKIAREVVEVGKPAYIKIVEEFGYGILLEDGNIDRKKLGSIIFNDKISREKLNEFTHPYIFDSIKEEVQRLMDKHNIIFLDIPLLFEQYNLWDKYNIRFDEIWLVYTDAETQVNRLMNREQMSKEEALKRIGSQMDIDYKKTKSSKTIDNNKDIEYLRRQIEKLLEEFN